MKIELKPRKKGGKQTKVFSFGRDEDAEADAKRRDRQEKALAEIGSTSAQELSADCRDVRPNADDRPEEESEEMEMKRLRGSVKFGAFSAKYGRDRRASREEDEPEEPNVQERESPLLPPPAAAAPQPTEPAEDADDDGDEENDNRRDDLEKLRGAEGSPEGPVEEEHEAASELPVSHEALLAGNVKASISCIALDRAGNRFCTGSLDHSVKFWDFGSMNSNLTSFKSMEPLGTFPIRSAEFSPTGGKLLIAGGANAARMFDRDGRELLVCPHGDMYLHDMANTKGHVAPLAAARWQPVDGKTFATAAADGTIRIWDATAEKLQKHKKIIRLRNKRGQKVNPTAIAYSPDGRRILAGCSDGGLRMYDPTSFAPKTVSDVADAHGEQVSTSSVQFSPDGFNVLTRTGDGCLRIWDIRRFDSPLVTFDDLPNEAEIANAVFSGDAKVFATCCSAPAGSKHGRGKIVFFDRATLRTIKTVYMDQEHGGATTMTWHASINQIMFGTSSGHAKVLYDPLKSSNGILRCISRVVKRKDDAVVNIGVGKIYTPNALPMFRDDEFGSRGRPMSKKRQMEKLREDPVLTKKPTLASGPDAKTIAGSTLASFVAQGQVKQTWMEEDPRAALLKMEDKTKNMKYFTGQAVESDPNRLLAEKTLEQEEEEERERLRQRLPAHKRKQADEQERGN